MADPQTPEEIEAERVRLEKEAAEKATAEKNAATEQRRAAKAAKQDAKSAPAEGPMAADRLRAFEDEVFGKRAVRMDGKVERGVGSPYAAMTDERKAQYAALEELVLAEQRLNDATAAVGAAEAQRVAAEERLAMCDKLAQEKAAAAEAEQAEIEKEKASAAG